MTRFSFPANSAAAAILKEIGQNVASKPEKFSGLAGATVTGVQPGLVCANLR